jgi:hypothetical protein
MFHVEPREVRATIAAQRMGLKAAKFVQLLPNLVARGFPKPDPDSGLFDLVAIDKWCDARHAHLFGGSAAMQARDAGTVARERIAAMRKGR